MRRPRSRRFAEQIYKALRHAMKPLLSPVNNPQRPEQLARRQQGQGHDVPTRYRGLMLTVRPAGLREADVGAGRTRASRISLYDSAIATRNQKALDSAVENNAGKVPQFV